MPASESKLGLQVRPRIPAKSGAPGCKPVPLAMLIYPVSGWMAGARKLPGCRTPNNLRGNRRTGALSSIPCWRSSVSGPVVIACGSGRATLTPPTVALAACGEQERAVDSLVTYC